MLVSSFFFYAFAAIAVLCSLFVILKKNPVASAFSLILVFFAFAGLYALMDAHLLAALQIFVYAGAVMVLFVFVIMLLNADVPSLDFGKTHLGLKISAALLSVMTLGIFIVAFQTSTSNAPVGAFTSEAIESAGGNTQVVAELMFSEYILPFELTSVLLLAAIVGAVAIAKRKLSNGRSSS